MFILESVSEKCAFMIVYADDIIITGNCVKLIAEVKKDLKQRFNMTDIGECKFGLGIELVYINMVVCVGNQVYPSTKGWYN